MTYDYGMHKCGYFYKHRKLVSYASIFCRYNFYASLDFPPFVIVIGHYLVSYVPFSLHSFFSNLYLTIIPKTKCV